MTDQCRQAVVLAAGEGSRLRPLTASRPKCLVEVAGRPMLDGLLDELESMAIDEVVIVTGHRVDALREHVQRFPRSFAVRYVHNEIYDQTNNAYSLWLARAEVRAPFLLAESDLVLDPGVLAPLRTPDRMVVARWDPTMSGTVVRVSPEGDAVERMILKRDQDGAMDLRDTFKTVNFYSFSDAVWSSEYRPALEATVDAGKVQDYYEASLGELINGGRVRLEPVDISATRWMEVDDHDDLARAEALFAVT